MVRNRRYRRLPVAVALALSIASTSVGCEARESPYRSSGRTAYQADQQRALISAIHHSRRSKKGLDGVKKLLASGASVGGVARCSRHQHTTPLVEAVVARDDAIVELLLARGADVNVVGGPRTMRWSALHYAVSSGQYYVVKALLAHGAKLETAGRFGSTPLHLAAASDMPGLVKLLLSKGAKINVLDKRDRTPLDYANYESVRLVLIRAGAKRARAFREAPAPEPAPRAKSPAAASASAAASAAAPSAKGSGTGTGTGTGTGAGSRKRKRKAKGKAKAKR